MFEFHASPGIRFPVSPARLKKVAGITARAVPVLRLGVEVELVTSRQIRVLNRTYRHKDQPTDVLSFSYVTAHASAMPPGFQLVGQMYLAPTVIQEQARRFKTTFRIEFIRMFIHGLLHCAGYDHLILQEARNMFSLQERLLRKALISLQFTPMVLPRTLTDDYFREQFSVPEA